MAEIRRNKRPYREVDFEHEVHVASHALHAMHGVKNTRLLTSKVGMVPKPMLSILSCQVFNATHDKLHEIIMGKH